MEIKPRTLEMGFDEEYWLVITALDIFVLTCNSICVMTFYYKINKTRLIFKEPYRRWIYIT